MGTSIQEQPTNTALSAIFAAHSGIDGAQPPELSAEARTENYAAATAAGVEDNGSVAGLAIVDTQKQMRLEKEEKKKQQATMMSEIEAQAQRMIDDLQAQIDALQEELDDKRREEARLSQDETDILFLRQLAQTDSFDMSNPEHREVYERALIENPDLVGIFDDDFEENERIRALDEALANTQDAIAEVTIEIAVLGSEIAARTDAINEIGSNMGFLNNDDPELSDERAALLSRILESHGLDAPDGDIDAIDMMRSLSVGSMEDKRDLAVLSDNTLVELGVEEEIGLFMRDFALFENGDINREELIERAGTLSDSAREQVDAANTELDSILSESISMADETNEAASMEQGISHALTPLLGSNI